MVSVTNPRGVGIAALLQASNGSSASGLFGAISGNVATSSTATNLFNAISPGSTSGGGSIDGLLQQQKITKAKNSIFANVAQRLDALQAGTYKPKSDWEKVAAYAMETGQPVAISLDSKGQVQAVPQAQSDLSKYNLHQQNQLVDALNQVSVMAQKIKANKTNDAWIAKLNGAEYDLSGVFSGQLAAQSNWERQGVQLMAEHKPFTISLDAQGNLQVQDQLLDPMTNLTATQQKALRSALSSLPKVIADGTVTEAWQADALTFDQNQVPYHLTIDPVSNQISAVENSGDNIIPTFLKTSPYPDIGANTPMLKAAADLIKNGKSFMLDFDQGGHITAKPTTAQNLIKFNTPATQINTALGTGSILSLFA